MGNPHQGVRKRQWSGDDGDQGEEKWNVRSEATIEVSSEEIGDEVMGMYVSRS